VRGRRGRRRRKLLDDLKERRGYSYLKEEVIDRTMWRAGFGRGFGPVARQTTTKGLFEPTTILQFLCFIPYRIAPACHPKVSADSSL